MSSWNHRVVRRKVKDGFIFGIHEAYYNKDKLEYITVNPVGISGETLEDLREYLCMVSKALTTPLVDYEYPFKEIKDDGFDTIDMNIQDDALIILAKKSVEENISVNDLIVDSLVGMIEKEKSKDVSDDIVFEHGLMSFVNKEKTKKKVNIEPPSFNYDEEHLHGDS